MEGWRGKPVFFAAACKTTGGDIEWMRLDSKEVSAKLKGFALTPQSPEERWAFTKEIDIANSYDQKAWLKQNIPVIVGSMFLLILFFGFMVFYENIWQPINEASARFDSMEARFFEHQKAWMSFVEGRQDMDAAVKQAQGLPPEAPPK